MRGEVFMPRCRLHFAIPVGVGVLLTLGLLLGSTILKRVSPTEIDSEGTDACDPANSAPAALPERRPAPIDDSATRRSAAERLLAAAIREVDDMREPSMKSITYGRIAEVQLKLGDVAAASENRRKDRGQRER